MGQQHSGFVVEIASPRLGRFQAVPQKEPDESPSSSREEWRITVNPAAELIGSDRLKALVDRLYHQQKLFTMNDARQILHALQAIDATADIMLPLLTVVSNATAFPANQMLMREARITDRVTEMLCSSRPCANACRVMLLQCVANMAVASENTETVKKAIPTIVKRLCTSQNEMEITVAMQALTNLSVNITPDKINIYSQVINPTMARLWVKGEANLNALRLMVNLSCCPDMVPKMLGSKQVPGLMRILDTDKDDVRFIDDINILDVLLRAVTWLLCTTSAVDALGISYDKVAQYNEDPFRNPQHTLYYSIYGPNSRLELESRCRDLLKHRNIEIAGNAGRLLDIIKNVPQYTTPGQGQPLAHL